MNEVNSPINENETGRNITDLGQGTAHRHLEILNQNQTQQKYKIEEEKKLSIKVIKQFHFRTSFKAMWLSYGMVISAWTSLNLLKKLASFEVCFTEIYSHY